MVEPNPHIDATIAEIARRQNGNITREQLLDAGLGAKAIAYRARVGRLFRVHSGVYAVGAPPDTPLEHATAAVLACGEGAALSHGSALALWGLAKRWPRPPHVAVAADRRPAGIAVHHLKLTRADLRVHFGIRVTGPARTLLDCAWILPENVLTRAVNDALRSPYMTEGQLADACRRHPHHRGRAFMLPVVETPAGPTRSQFEDVFLRFCRRFGLPRPLVNARVHGYEVDAYFRDEGVIVELDGWDFHRSRGSFERDRDRDANLLAAGLVTVRITWQRLRQRPHEEAERLLSILARRREERAR
jgi:hypothetical protein